MYCRALYSTTLLSSSGGVSALKLLLARVGKQEGGLLLLNRCPGDSSHGLWVLFATLLFAGLHGVSIECFAVDRQCALLVISALSALNQHLSSRPYSVISAFFLCHLDRSGEI